LGASDHSQIQRLNKNEKLPGVIDKLLAAPDEQFAALAETQKSPEDSALALVPYSAPFLETKFAALSSLDTELQNRLYEIRANLAMLNHDVEQAQFYFRLTFGDLSEGNCGRVLQNLVGVHKKAADRAQIVADGIGKIRWSE
jgi:hypothetical protein